MLRSMVSVGLCLCCLGWWFGEANAQGTKKQKLVSAKEKRVTTSRKASAQNPREFRLNDPSGNFWLRAHAEVGFLGILSHKIQVGKSGTYFDYVGDGGQNNLFLYLRLSLDMTLFRRHNVSFLYQPLDLRSQTILRGDLVQDMASFQGGEAVDFRYGFDFYRVSYTYDVFADPKRELSFGVSMQLRNAAIVFTNASGTKRTYRNDVGIVPLLKARGWFPLTEDYWFGFEVDGLYAPVSYLNGSTTEIVGAFVDASVRLGRRLLPSVHVFLNIRYIGGGSVGSQTVPDEPKSDGYLKNWIHSVAISAGLSLR